MNNQLTQQTNPVTAMMDQAPLSATLFPATSRYYGIDTAVISVAGQLVRYLLRRFVPSPENFQTIQEHVVTQGERLDNITAKYLGDPTLFWRICDANRAMQPEELTETVGRSIRITLPDGVTGTTL